MAMKRLHKMALMACTLAVLELGLLITPTAAQDRACAADVKKFCQGVPAGQRQGCLKEHVAELSEPCKARIQAAQQKVQDLREACQGEVAQYCQGVAAGGALAQCLQQNVSKVSPECKTALAQAKPTTKPRP
jgi:hypothetical protein